MVNTSQVWSLEYDTGTEAGYRLTGFYLDILIKYEYRGAEEWQATVYEMDNTFINNEEPTGKKFLVYKGLDQAYHAHNGYHLYTAWAWERDEAVLNSWLLLFINRHFDAMTVK